ncbi:hypothetical protein QYE76_039450 [Lolium multiflorum]|uniref:TF-B3 domain-containing protein n=1 Tax=Lolium multiflorum TaxID=4521 RepID=A0AAD8WRU6_LOLMU|nr:hypothetical protein QYE76_039450 [Lolium multiflorum]
MASETFPPPAATSAVQHTDAATTVVRTSTGHEATTEAKTCDVQHIATVGGGGTEPDHSSALDSSGNHLAMLRSKPLSGDNRGKTTEASAEQSLTRTSTIQWSSTASTLKASSIMSSPAKVDDNNSESLKVSKVGMVFKSEEDAYEFYNEYAGAGKKVKEATIAREGPQQFTEAAQATDVDKATPTVGIPTACPVTAAFPRRICDGRREERLRWAQLEAVARAMLPKLMADDVPPAAWAAFRSRLSSPAQGERWGGDDNRISFPFEPDAARRSIGTGGGGVGEQHRDIGLNLLGSLHRHLEFARDLELVLDRNNGGSALAPESLVLRRITFRDHQPSTCFLAPPGSIKPWFLSEGKLATIMLGSPAEVPGEGPTKKHRGRPAKVGHFHEDAGPDHFLRIIFKPTFGRLMIPKAFVKWFGEIPSNIIVTTNTGCNWRMTTRRESNNTFIDQEWTAFAIAHQLKVGQFLTFKKVSSFEYSVVIFDHTCTKVVSRCLYHGDDTRTSDSKINKTPNKMTITGGIRKRITISRTKLNIKLHRSIDDALIPKSSTSKKILNVLFLRDRKAIRSGGNLNAKKIAKRTKISHKKLISKTSLDEGNILRIITSNDHIINIEKKKSTSTRRSVNEKCGIMKTRRETSSSHHRGEALKPGTRGLFETIERTSKTTNHPIGNRIPRRRLHVNLLTQLAIKKSILNIKLETANVSNSKKGTTVVI